MRLTVLSVAFPFAVVGPSAVGGAEQVLWSLDSALTRVGHRSIVIACEGSQTSGVLLSVPAVRKPGHDEARQAIHRECRERIEQAVSRWKIDVVHFHGVDFDRYLVVRDVPVLITLHLPPEWYPREVLCASRPNVVMHCVSHSQRCACPEGLALLPVIENGVPVNALSARHAKRRYALMLARICLRRTFMLHSMPARVRACPCFSQGMTYPFDTHEQYFQSQVVPRLTGMHRYLGPVDFERKRRLMTAARCVLVPSLAPETSSLVAMEALACGTPVIAYASGALPEIVEHGRTGFIVKDEREMAEAMEAAASLDPDACRAAARARFALDRMTRQYFAVYERLAALRAARAAPAAADGHWNFGIA